MAALQSKTAGYPKTYNRRNSKKYYSRELSPHTLPNVGGFSSRLKSARRAAGLSQAQVAERLGVRQPSYSRLETGVQSRSKYLLELAAILGVNAEWLASGKGPRELAPDADIPAGADDAEIAALWRSLSAEKRKLLLTLLRAAAGDD